MGSESLLTFSFKQPKTTFLIPVVYIFQAGPKGYPHTIFNMNKMDPYYNYWFSNVSALRGKTQFNCNCIDDCVCKEVHIFPIIGRDIILSPDSMNQPIASSSYTRILRLAYDTGLSYLDMSGCDLMFTILFNPMGAARFKKHSADGLSDIQNTSLLLTQGPAIINKFLDTVFKDCGDMKYNVGGDSAYNQDYDFSNIDYSDPEAPFTKYGDLYPGCTLGNIASTFNYLYSCRPSLRTGCKFFYFGTDYTNSTARPTLEDVKGSARRALLYRFNREAAFQAQSSYGTLESSIRGLFIKSTNVSVNYTNYFYACSPSSCTVPLRPTMFTIVTVVLGLAGGIVSGLEILLSVVFSLIIFLTTRKPSSVHPALEKVHSVMEDSEPIETAEKSHPSLGVIGRTTVEKGCQTLEFRPARHWSLKLTQLWMTTLYPKGL